MNNTKTLKAELMEITSRSVALCHDTEVHFIDEMKPGIDPTVIGSYSFNDGRRRSSKEQHFYITVGGEVVAERLYKEIDMIVGLGEKMERLFKETAFQILDVRLPKSHGFSGIKYGYRRTKELFGHAGLPPLRKSRVEGKFTA